MSCSCKKSRENNKNFMMGVSLCGQPGRSSFDLEQIKKFNTANMKPSPSFEKFKFYPRSTLAFDDTHNPCFYGIAYHPLS